MKNTPRSLSFSSTELAALRRDFSKLDEVTPFSNVPKLAGKIASLGIFREVGTVNDETARFIFNAKTGVVVDRSSLKAEIIDLNGFTGVRIWSTETDRLELRARWFRELLNPDLSFDERGNIFQLVVFPEIVARIVAREGVEAVLVKSWGMNSIFGGFDPAKGYYQTNFWELENNDALKFANIVRHGRVAFLGTHDLIAHLAGVNAERWPLLKQQAERVYAAIDEYFRSTPKPSVASLILPYTAGVILDDLAQPPTYASPSHAAFLDALIDELNRRTVPAELPTMLTRFPGQFEKIIEASRDPQTASRPLLARELVSEMVQEILCHSVNWEGGQRRVV